jgi:hypothetical protein
MVLIPGLEPPFVVFRPDTPMLFLINVLANECVEFLMIAGDPDSDSTQFQYPILPVLIIDPILLSKRKLMFELQKMGQISCVRACRVAMWRCSLKQAPHTSLLPVQDGIPATLKD